MGMCVIRRAALAVGLAVGALALPGPPAGVAGAQAPSLDCDVPFPTGARGTVATRHDCWLEEPGGSVPVPWPGPGSFAPGSVVTVYSLRWDSAGNVRLYCSAESSRGADYDRWFVAAAVRGGTELEQASYGVRGASVPGGDRVVSSFVGGRSGRVQWERGSRYDAAARRWVSDPWRVDMSAPAPPEPAFIRSRDAEEAEAPADPSRSRRPALHAGYTCPEFGLMPRQLGDRVDDAPRGSEDPYRCLDPPSGPGEIFAGDVFNVQAQYLPGRGRFGDGTDDDDDEDEDVGDGGQGGDRGGNQGRGGNPGQGGRGGHQGGRPGQGGSRGGHQGQGGGGEQGGGVPTGPDCGGENNAVCEDPEDNEDEEDEEEESQETETPEEGEGRVATPPESDSGGALGSGRRLAEAPVVAAFSSGMACVERESLVLARHERQTWVDTSHTVYDPVCHAPPGLRPRSCDTDGFDPSGQRLVADGHWDTWWEHVWEANPAETDAHLPWARIFWHDGGGRTGFESGGVLVGDDGTAACLVAQGFVRNPGLPGVVPAVASRLAGAWTDYAGGTVSVQCPKEDGSTGFTSPPAGSPAAAFDVLVSLDFGPAIHDEAAREAYTLAEYRASRPCGDWPADAADPPVPGVDCDVPLAVSAARRARLGAFERSVRTSAGTGRITGFWVDAPAAMMAHSWDVRRASELAGRLALDTPWDGGSDVGGGTASEARVFGPPVSPWADCGRRDFLMGTGVDSLWGAWVERAGVRRGGEVAAAVALLGLAGGFDPRTTVSCTPGGECTHVPGAFDAHHLVIEQEARRLRDARAADPDRVCGIGDRVSPPGP